MTEQPSCAPILLTVVTITKGDPEGCARTLVSMSALRADSRVEHLVVDGDGAARAIAKSAGCLWVRQDGVGIAGAFNEGLAVARGEWIWFLNGGDRVHSDLDPCWLIALLVATKADLITGGIQYDGDLEFRPVPPLRLQFPPIDCWLAHPATLVRRGALRAQQGFDPRWRIAMDYDLWIRLLLTDVVVDAVSVPFAAFDVSGVSQRIETRPCVRAESGKILLRHCGRLFRAWLWIGGRLLFGVCRAWRGIWHVTDGNIGTRIESKGMRRVRE